MIQPDQFLCSIRFMFDLHTIGANAYRDDIKLGAQMKLLSFVEKHAKRGGAHFFDVLDRREFLPQPLAGQRLAGSGPFIPLIKPEDGYDGVDDLIRRAAVVYEEGVLGSQGAAEPVVEDFVITFGAPPETDGFAGNGFESLSHDLSCKQRVWNPVKKRWEWEYNYTMTTTDGHYLPSSFRDAYQAEFGGSPPHGSEKILGSLRLAARVYELCCGE